MQPSELAQFLAAISAIASAIAASAAWFQVRKVAQSNEVTAFLHLMKDYSTPEMRLSISRLSKAWRVSKTRDMDIVTYYKSIEAGDESEAETIRGCSRVVSSYFVDAVRLYELRLISRNLLRAAVAHPGLNAFYEVAVPINQYKNGGHNSVRAAKVLKVLIPRHGDGIY